MLIVDLMDPVSPLRKVASDLEVIELGMIDISSGVSADAIDQARHVVFNIADLVPAADKQLSLISSGPVSSQ